MSHLKTDSSSRIHVNEGTFLSIQSRYVPDEVDMVRGLLCVAGGAGLSRIAPEDRRGVQLNPSCTCNKVWEST